MPSTSTMLTMHELNKLALDQFVYQPVTSDMITYLADAAHSVISCDSTMMPTQTQTQPRTDSPSSTFQHRPNTPPDSPQSSPAKPSNGNLPSVEDFITQLVVSSNVQVPTLMSTLVYLARLKSKLQPMARGLRCTTHRIFLASLILAAKYLNDSSPKNKHWANYTNMDTALLSFGFNRTEVNLMEKQLLFLLEWDLRIVEQDLYRELDSFLEPIRQRIAHAHAKRVRHREEKRRQQEAHAAAAATVATAVDSSSSCAFPYPSPPSSCDSSRTRHAIALTRPTIIHARSMSPPPGLTYSRSASSASSYDSSLLSSSSRQHSRSATPLDSDSDPFVHHARLHDSLYDSPVELSMEKDAIGATARLIKTTPGKIFHDMSPAHYHQLQDCPSKKRHRRGMWSRLLGTSVAVR